MQNMANFNNVLKKSPMDLLNWLMDSFSVQIPEVIVSIDDMAEASKILLKLSGAYSYLMALLSYAKIMTRDAKRKVVKNDPETTRNYEDMVDRKEVLQHFTDIVKQNYTAVSRAVTIYIENNNELKMGRGTP